MIIIFIMYINSINRSSCCVYKMDSYSSSMLLRTVHDESSPESVLIINVEIVASLAGFPGQHQPHRCREDPPA